MFVISCLIKICKGETVSDDGNRDAEEGDEDVIEEPFKTQDMRPKQLVVIKRLSETTIEY